MHGDGRFPNSITTAAACKYGLVLWEIGNGHLHKQWQLESRIIVWTLSLKEGVILCKRSSIERWEREVEAREHALCMPTLMHIIGNNM